MANSLFNRFVQGLGALKRPRTAEPPRVHLAIFGKHPGWDDHIPGFGLTDPAIVKFNQWLYEGIGRNIDNGEWNKLEKTGNLRPFAHTLVHANDRDCIVARCWQSVDGKGRAEYPMIAAASCSSLPIQWILREIVPSLMTLESQLKAAKTAAQVQQLFTSADTALQQTIAVDAAVSPAAPPETAFLQISSRPEMGSDHLGFQRLVYHVEREVPPLPPAGKTSLHKTALAPRSFSMRVPLCADNGLAAAQLWIRFLLGHPDMPPAILACVADSATFLDLIVGVPNAGQLFCLRASAEVLPLTTDIPYTLDAAFSRRVDLFLESLRNGGEAAPAFSWPE